MNSSLVIQRSVRRNMNALQFICREIKENYMQQNGASRAFVAYDQLSYLFIYLLLFMCGGFFAFCWKERKCSSYMVMLLSEGSFRSTVLRKRKVIYLVMIL
jgi:hypothetical protein